MKPVDVKSNTYINSSKEVNNKDPKFKIVDIVRISRYKNIFAKGYVPNWLEEVLVIKKVKNTVPWTYVISDLKVKKLLERFTKMNWKEHIKKSLEMKKIKRKGDKLYVKWKGYDNSFNNWIDKKHIVQMSAYFPEPKRFGKRVIVELDLSNYATKAYLKNETGLDTSKLVKKVDLAC